MDFLPVRIHAEYENSRAAEAALLFFYSYRALCQKQRTPLQLLRWVRCFIY